MIDRIVLFGATGDLAGRRILPSLAQLFARGHLPGGFRLVGSGRRSWDDDAYRAWAREELVEHAPLVVEDARTEFLNLLSYRAADLADPSEVRGVLAAAGPGEPPVLVYLALPTGIFPAALSSLGEVGLAGGSRVALEKPFGEDLDSARALNAQLAELTGDAGEDAIFRVDHALAMSTVQNLLGMRLANRVLEPLWNGEHVAQVDVLWEETLALEGRASYYDTAGALKDVIQNHVLQVLSIVAMELPTGSDGEELRDRKIEVLRAVPTLTTEQVRERTRRARYTSGVSADTGEPIPDYAAEDGVDPERGTETFAQVDLEIDTPRWAGTRFRLRAGKALAARRKEVVLHFRAPSATPPFTSPAESTGRRTVGNALVVGIDGPFDITLRLAGLDAGPPPHPAPILLRGEPAAQELPPYARVLLDALGGGNRLSVRGDVAEEAWRIVMPVLDAWADDVVPLETYPAGAAIVDRANY